MYKGKLVKRNAMRLSKDGALAFKNQTGSRDISGRKNALRQDACKRNYKNAQNQVIIQRQIFWKHFVYCDCHQW
jgi:hypothetical protein